MILTQLYYDVLNDDLNIHKKEMIICIYDMETPNLFKFNKNLIKCYLLCFYFFAYINLYILD